MVTNYRKAGEWSPTGVRPMHYIFVVVFYEQTTSLVMPIKSVLEVTRNLPGDEIAKRDLMI